MTLEASFYRADKEILGGHTHTKKTKTPLSTSIFSIKQQINHESGPSESLEHIKNDMKKRSHLPFGFFRFKCNVYAFTCSLSPTLKCKNDFK